MAKDNWIPFDSYWDCNSKWLFPVNDKNIALGVNYCMKIEGMKIVSELGAKLRKGCSFASHSFPYFVIHILFLPNLKTRTIFVCERVSKFCDSKLHTILYSALAQQSQHTQSLLCTNSRVLGFTVCVILKLA